MLRIKKIISGGQTGADQAALKFARKHGIQTGGFIPKGSRTESGNNPSLKKFGLVETSSRSYNDRTMLNIKISDGTVIFSKLKRNGSIKGKGTKLTYELCLKKKKPVVINPDPDTLKKFIRKNKIKILNVAGDRKSANPYIGRIVSKTLREVLT